ncbi:TNFAIP3-interacting protein 1 isoform X2 [Erinaceus europaeus]|uniref:TNFAIP3-interacting protein 1 isoform X2 n=1 Tax=Erinaceus europaeus TaxID=9365 RepID=A0ABM3XYU2_ERIEU|nr:TNFAIP3-interacting protein 1 isoform X2 [Erinaceus europaeus]
MEGRGPYRIYDPGGSVPPAEVSAAFERLAEENSRLKEKMQGIKMLGELLGESQMEASRLRQKAEDLVRDNEPQSPSPSLTSFDHLDELTGKAAHGPAPPAEPLHPSDKPEPTPKPPSGGSSSEFEVVPTEEQSSHPESSSSAGPAMRQRETEGGGEIERKKERYLQHCFTTCEVSPLQALGPPPREDSGLLLHLQRLESTLSVCAEEPDHSQLFTHLGRMALEFNRLASKVHKNEQRTSILQTLCEQLRKENEALKSKLDQGLEQRDQAAEKLREENVELRRLLSSSREPSVSSKKGVAGHLQAAVTSAKASEVVPMGVAEKKVKMLEQQRSELLEVNKQWDQHFRSMKQQYEQKITELRQKLADLQKQVTELEAEREQKQRDFDRKLLLAKSKIEMEEANKEQLTTEAQELRQKVKCLQDQLSPLARQRDYQEKEIQRLNKALEEALSIEAAPSAPPAAFGGPEGAEGLLRKRELVTQNELLKQQVKIFEEDFQKERSDRERMNEEKEELKRQLEKLQAQVSMSNAQLKAFKEEEKAREALKQQKRKAKASAERYHMEPHLEHLCGAYPYAYPPLPAMVPHHPFDDWAQIRYPPSPMAMEHSPPLPNSRLFHLPEYTWRPQCGLRHQNSQVTDSPTTRPTEPEPADLRSPKK